MIPPQFLSTHVSVPGRIKVHDSYYISWLLSNLKNVGSCIPLFAPPESTPPPSPLFLFISTVVSTTTIFALLAPIPPFTVTISGTSTNPLPPPDRPQGPRVPVARIRLPHEPEGRHEAEPRVAPEITDVP